MQAYVSHWFSRHREFCSPLQDNHIPFTSRGVYHCSMDVEVHHIVRSLLHGLAERIPSAGPEELDIHEFVV
jgi:hypothetical protein